ncbi:MAG: dephospho-CoA kinase [Bacteroidetes bacterium]|jgi:dephospho-CoA kinase|nr:dephospho-CoA kinase [Bacteroidota bacterium]MBT6687368.1 dephospho-CoA kinase [Bacteroidota bacterium]MBT7143919.1 dephospho-CoA kinase [Bacteroidota bacterium]MBT7492423.1 dephospho-CoA kinase [Bacteroidota bacterium]
MSLKVGITGGIGSGKSIVCEIFKQLGIVVFQADLAAKQIINNNEQVKLELISKFGIEIYNDLGEINKTEFAKNIFNNQKNLQTVNSIIHPIVKLNFDEVAKKHNNKKYIIKEAAILFESGAYKELDKIITVSAPLEIRIKRVIERDNTERQLVIDRIKNQISEEERIEKSDFVIVNDEKNLLVPQILSIDKILKTIK